MLRTVNAVIDPHGHVRLTEPVELSSSRQALVTILDAAPGSLNADTALLSEAALAEDWNRQEEEEAWSHLQSEP